jgi:large subunit ribosomal protein L9
MDVILLERIDNLGQMGDVVKVKNGYARNFLLPRKKALRATEASRKQFEAQRAQLEATNLERRKEAEQVAKKVDGISVVLVRQAGEGGQLFGSVSARDVADAVAAAGVTVSRGQILLDRPIKTVGIHDVRVSLHPEVKVTVKANVARTQEEAEIQARTGRAVIGGEDEEQKRAAVVANAEQQLEAVFDKPLDEDAKGELTGKAKASEEVEAEAAEKPAKKKRAKKAKDEE